MKCAVIVRHSFVEEACFSLIVSNPPAGVSLRTRNGATCFFEGQKSMQKTLRLLMLLWKNYVEYYVGNYVDKYVANYVECGASNKR